MNRSPIHSAKFDTLKMWHSHTINSKSPNKKILLNIELVFSDRDAVDELESGPKPVKLCAFVNVDNAICRGLSVPDGVVQVTLDSVQDHLEYGQTAAKTFSGQEVTWKNLSN